MIRPHDSDSLAAVLPNQIPLSIHRLSPTRNPAGQHR